MLSGLFAVFLSVLHSLYSAWKFLKNSWNYTLRKYECVINKTGVEDDLKSISKNVKRLNKVPAHLAIIVVNEEISYNDLASIILWCVAARISFLSFYDHTGVLKRNEMKLHSALFDKWKEPNVTWGNAPLRNGIQKKNGLTNGISSKAVKTTEDWPVLHVSVLSSNEGRQAFTEATRRICENVQSGSLDISKIDEEIIDRELSLGSKERPIVDPELAVWCGETSCNCGFLPWHIRVTQFLHLQTHHEIKAKDFISLLEAYSKCHQRFGK